MSNGIHPDRMTAAERLDEIGAILCLGIRRLRQKSNNFNEYGDVSLDFPGEQRVHGRNTEERQERP